MQIKSNVTLATAVIEGAGVVATLLKRKLDIDRKECEMALAAYPKDYLPDKGATSEVTGGHPEEINQMPADTDQNDENAVYDGADVKLTGTW